MKINVKVLLFLTVFICSCCTGNACASNVAAMGLSFNPAPPFWPGENVVMTASVTPSQPGVYVQIQSEIGGYFASGYTDSNGEFTGVYTVPDDALELVQYTSQGGSICFTAICPESEDQGWAQSNDYYCEIVPEAPPESSNVVAMDLSFNPEPPFWPGEEVAITASVYPSQPGAYVQIQSEFGGYFASGYTDSNGEFTGVYTVPDDALERVQYASQIGSIGFTAICPSQEIWVQSLDYYCEIVPAEEDVIAIDLSFNPEPPFWPGEEVTITANVYPSQPGVYVRLQSEYGGDFFASGYTDSNGEFTGVYTIPDDALEWAQYASQSGSMCFSAYCPDQGRQSMDYFCNIVPAEENVVAVDMVFNPNPPFWPGEEVTITANVYPSQPGVYVRLQSEYGGDFFASGYTDSNGEFTGVYTISDDALEWAQSASQTGYMAFSAYCPDQGRQSMDYFCYIVPKPVPGYTNPPKDLDQDVLYEDINGNGILDFDDVVAYYDNMEWIEENAQLELFDYNKNGLIDFDDVVKLYDML